MNTVTIEVALGAGGRDLHGEDIACEQLARRHRHLLGGLVSPIPFRVIRYDS